VAIAVSLTVYLKSEPKFSSMLNFQQENKVVYTEKQKEPKTRKTSGKKGKSGNFPQKAEVVATLMLRNVSKHLVSRNCPVRFFRPEVPSWIFGKLSFFFYFFKTHLLIHNQSG
jgi:hypothetical protein